MLNGDKHTNHTTGWKENLIERWNALSRNDPFADGKIRLLEKNAINHLPVTRNN